jgi:hypothetical protein
MMKSITTTMLVSAMAFAWGTIRAGERGVERSEAIGSADLKDYAGLWETMAARKGCAMVRTGERLELWVSALAMKLGYRDGEVAGLVAWPISPA